MKIEEILEKADKYRYKKEELCRIEKAIEIIKKEKCRITIDDSDCYSTTILYDDIFDRIRGQVISLLKEEVDTIKRIMADLEG